MLKKVILNVDYHMFYHEGFVFLVATEVINADDKAYEFLRACYERFTALRLDRRERYSKHCLKESFKTDLGSIMQQYNMNKKLWSTHQSMQSMGQIRQQVEEVTNIMRDNIDSVLDRGEALEDIVTRANDLQATTDVFHRQTTQINRQLYYRNRKLKLIIIGSIVFVVLLIIIYTALKATSHKPKTTSSATLAATAPSLEETVNLVKNAIKF